MQVVAGAAHAHLSGQSRGIGGHDQFKFGCAAQGQPGHTLGGVLVGKGVVAPGIGAFRHAPGQGLAGQEGDVLAHGSLARFAQRTALGFAQYERGHQVFKHRARPRAQARQAAHGKVRPPQCGPVRHGHVTLGNGQQAGHARLGGQQVVKSGVQHMVVNAVANVQQVSFGVIQEAEVGFPRQGFQPLGQRLQAQRRGQGLPAGSGLCISPGAGQRVGQVGLPPGVEGGSGFALGRKTAAGCQPGLRQGSGMRGRGGVKRVGGQCLAGLCHCQQVRAEVAAVHGRHIARVQGLQGLGVVPVQKMPLVTLQAHQCGQGHVQAVQHVQRAQPAERAGTGCAQQVQAYVGG